MSINNMTVGKDYTIVLFDRNTNAIIELDDVQNFSITARKNDINSSPYNAVPRFGYIPDGYEMKFELVRINSALENYQLDAAARFNSGEHQLAGFLNETVTDADGSIHKYQYINFVFWLGDLGEVTRDKTVSMRAEGMASDKIRLI